MDQAWLDLLADNVDAMAAGHADWCDAPTANYVQLRCDTAERILQQSIAAGLVEVDPGSANGALRLTSCGGAVCHLTDNISSLLVPGNSLDPLGFVIGLSGLETAGNFAIWRSLPNGSTTTHNLQPGGASPRRAGERGAVSLPGGSSWNPRSRNTFGHTFDTHGSGPSNTRSLTGRAGGTGQGQGQWLDNAAAARLLQSASNPTAGPRSIPIPPGLGRVILPSGQIVPATHATLVPLPGGNGYRTAYPVVGGGPWP